MSKFRIIIVISFILVFTLGAAYYVKTINWVDNPVSSNQTNTQQNTDAIFASTESARSVCLVAGHGGNDPGAEYKNIQEMSVNLTVALKVKQLLESDGYTVYLSRGDNETTMYKAARKEFCNQTGASIMVAIHHNAYGDDSSVDYGTALYYKDSDKALASSILKSTTSILNVESKGISKYDDSELYDVSMPAVITEAFFMTNNSEYSLIKSADSLRLQLEAEAIAKGIANYFDGSMSDVVAENSNPLVIDRNDL